MQPCAIVATVGNTSTGAVDPTRAIGELAAREKIWLHVDGAYAGSATICPELRDLWDGIEYADSIVTNPHKWMFTPIDCSVLYTRRPDVLRAAFAPAETPAYLTLSDTADINYMDFGVPMGRAHGSRGRAGRDQSRAVNEMDKEIDRGVSICRGC